MKLGVLLVLTVGCGLVAGCGGSDLPLVHIRGQVKFDGGPCPANGTVVYVPIPDSGIPGMPDRAGRGVFETDGKFEVTSYKPGDGLLPGRYQVSISCIDGEPSPARPKDKISYIAPGYKPDELVVEKGQKAIVVNYDVPRKKG